jgi:hypothetical protein
MQLSRSRTIPLFALCAAAAFGQPSQPGGEDGWTNRKAVENAIRRALENPGKVTSPAASAPARRCSIPLLRVLPRAKPVPMPQIGPKAATAAMPLFQGPAPPCEEPPAPSNR